MTYSKSPNKSQLPLQPILIAESPCKTGEIEAVILDPHDGPIYRVWLDDYELTTVYGWEIEAL